MLKKIFFIKLGFFFIRNSVFTELIFKYGLENGDIVLPKSFLSFDQYDIGFKFPYLNIHYDHLYISQNGYIGFKSPDYYINIYRSEMTNMIGNGSIFYQSYVDRQIELEDLKLLVQTKMGDRFKLEFNPSNAFVITWHNIRNQNQSIESTVTFQIILITDEFRSFLIFNYGELNFPCSQISLRHVTGYVSFTGHLESANQNSNINQEGVFIFETNANFVCDQAQIDQEQILSCFLLSNDSEVYNLEVKFCNQSFTHQPKENNTSNEKFEFLLTCAKIGLIEIQIIEKNTNYLFYTGKINVISRLNTELLNDLTTLENGSLNDKFSTKIMTEMITESLESKYITSTETNYQKTLDYNYNWFVLSIENKSNNLVKKYFKAFNYSTEIHESLILLEDKRTLDLIICLNNCNESSKCKIIQFEKEKCRIFDIKI